MKLTREQIQEIIPHRDPMLLVDTVEGLEPGVAIITRFYVDPAREIFKGHFPNDPVLPGVYSVECMSAVMPAELIRQPPVMEMQALAFLAGPVVVDHPRPV